MNAISLLAASSESGLPAARIRELLKADELFGLNLGGELYLSRTALPMLRQLAQKAAPVGQGTSSPSLSDRKADGMKRYQVKAGFSVHGERGVLRGPDTFPEGWLPADHLEDLLAAGLIVEVIEEPPAPPAVITTDQTRPSAGRKGK